MSAAPGPVALPLPAARHLPRSVRFRQVGHSLPVGAKPPGGGGRAWQPDSRPARVTSDIRPCEVGTGRVETIPQEPAAALS